MISMNEVTMEDQYSPQIFDAAEQKVTICEPPVKNVSFLCFSEGGETNHESRRELGVAP